MMDQVRGAEGLELAHDWIADQATEKTPDTELSHDQRRHYAVNDMMAVSRADVVWLLAPNELTIGAWVEFGFAMGLAFERGLDGGCAPRMVASGPTSQTIFCACAHEEHAYDQQAFESIVAFARSGREVHGEEREAQAKNRGQ